MDCIESVRYDRTCLLTLVDRLSRECLIFKIGRQSQEAVQRRLNGLERQLGRERFREQFKSITVDNGAEFLNSSLMENRYMGPINGRPSIMPMPTRHGKEGVMRT